MVGPRRREDNRPRSRFRPARGGKIRLFPFFPGRRPDAAPRFSGGSRQRPGPSPGTAVACAPSSKAASWPLRPGLVSRQARDVPCVELGSPSVTGGPPPHSLRSDVDASGSSPPTANLILSQAL